jgi:hypothetical protein
MLVSGDAGFAFAAGSRQASALSDLIFRVSLNLPIALVPYRADLRQRADLFWTEHWSAWTSRKSVNGGEVAPVWRYALFRDLASTYADRRGKPLEFRKSCELSCMPGQ